MEKYHTNNVYVGNYNELQVILKKRSHSYERIVTILSQAQVGTNISLDQVNQLIPYDLLRESIDLTEKTIVMIDDLIIELTSFLDSFTKILESSIDLKKIKHLGGVMSTTSPPDDYRYLYERCTVVDYEQLADLFCEDIEIVRNRYRFGQMTSESN